MVWTLYIKFASKSTFRQYNSALGLIGEPTKYVMGNTDETLLIFGPSGFSWHQGKHSDRLPLRPMLFPVSITKHPSGRIT